MLSQVDQLHSTAAHLRQVSEFLNVLRYRLKIFFKKNKNAGKIPETVNVVTKDAAELYFSIPRGAGVEAIEKTQ